jgi:3-methyladenine DNA glycosylase AlkC
MSEEVETKFSLKDHLFNPEKIERITTEIIQVFPQFKKESFKKEVVSKFAELELKDRIYHITDCFQKYLPKSYTEAANILVRSLPEPCNPHLNDNDFGDFIYAPHAHFVATYGRSKEHLDFSLHALEEITTRFSAEDAIRYFINAFPDETMAKMKEWSTHSHYHVRRLASEGTRAKLPWCQKINIPIEAPLPILDNLYCDSTRYVTRSVANHLNDISKTQATIVLKQLKKWKQKNKQLPNEMDFIIRHSLRTLIKQGHREALELIGIEKNPAIEINNFTISEQVKMNHHLLFEFTLHAKENTSLLIDYIINFQNKKGEMNSRKVFKLKQVALKKNENITLTKKHLMKQFMTTRTLYAGKHELELQINGEIVLREKFHLL